MARNVLQVTAVAGLAALCATGSIAQEEAGAGAYRQYCATCHGVDGTGDGPLTDLLTTPVADLTQLSANNDGNYPMLQVIHVIDGRTGMRGHGGPMPVYGALFDEESNGDLTGSVLYTRGKILSLAYYIESLQAE